MTPLRVYAQASSDDNNIIIIIITSRSYRIIIILYRRISWPRGWSVKNTL